MLFPVSLIYRFLGIGRRPPEMAVVSGKVLIASGLRLPYWSVLPVSLPDLRRNRTRPSADRLFI